MTEYPGHPAFGLGRIWQSGTTQAVPWRPRSPGKALYWSSSAYANNTNNAWNVNFNNGHVNNNNKNNDNHVRLVRGGES